MLDIGEYPLSLGFAHVDAIARRHVFLVEVAVALAGLGRDRNEVPKDVRNDALARRVEACDFDLFLIGASVPHEGMAVAGGRPGTKVDVVDSPGRRLWLDAGLLGVLRTGRLNLHHRGDRGCTQAQSKAARSCL